jgi:hypothetical protein
VKSSSLKGVLVLFCIVAAAACSGPQQAAPPSTQAPAAAASAAPASGSLAATVSSGDFGVPECDDYMKKYLACIDSKVPDMARAQLKQAFEQQKSAWKQAASTPQGKSALATGCTQALATAKQSMAAYSCQW